MQKITSKKNRLHLTFIDWLAIVFFSFLIFLIAISLLGPYVLGRMKEDEKKLEVGGNTCRKCGESYPSGWGHYCSKHIDSAQINENANKASMADW